MSKTGLDKMRERYEEEREELFQAWLESRRDDGCPNTFGLPKLDDACDFSCRECWENALESEVDE